jgi:hypothetical protein
VWVQKGWNTLDKFLDGRTELLSYGVARIYDFVANRNQDVCAAFDQAQRRNAICLERPTVGTSSAANRVYITLTSTISTATQILSRILPARSNPGTGANCKRSTPVKSTSWPTLAAVPRTPPIALIACYRTWVSVKLEKRNGLTARVWVYPFACSMGFMRLRFKLSPRVDEVAIALSLPDFCPPTRSENAGERERDGMKAANGDSAGALVAGAA